MRQVTAFLALLVCLSLTPIISTAATPDCIRIATPVLAGEANTDGSGLYLDLLRAVYTPLNIDLCIEIVPFKRVVHMLRNQTADASIAFYAEESDNRIGLDYYIKSRAPIGTERLVAIFKKSAFPNWNYPQSLKKQRVAWIFGHDIDKGLAVPIDYQKITSTAQGWNLLKVGRIDIFIESYSNALAAGNGLDYIDLNQYEFKTIAEKSLYMPFAKTKRGQNFKMLFDRRLQELWQSGELDQMYRSWGRELPPDAD
ncbi:MAG: transporter substrate-binding domain-containing protein [Desulfobulbus sp.]|nr:transporter substrate-binding domain-containing protein [Desulfobulbus sp.]